MDPGGGFGHREAEAVGDGEDCDGAAVTQHLHAEGRLQEAGPEGAGVERH